MLSVQTCPSSQLALLTTQTVFTQSRQPAHSSLLSTQMWFSHVWQPVHSSSEQQPDSGMQASPAQHFGVSPSQHAAEPSSTGQQAVSQQPSEPQHWLSSTPQH